MLSQSCSKARGDLGTVISTGVKESDRKEARRASLIKKWAGSNSLGKSYEFEMPNQFGTSKESSADKSKHEIQLEERMGYPEYPAQERNPTVPDISILNIILNQCAKIFIAIFAALVVLA